MESVFRRLAREGRGLGVVEYVLLGSFLALSVASMLPMIGANIDHVLQQVRSELAAH